ncbi:hypothetical protein N7517_002440 [Penicillium concentricum]|uniref:Uncharacterized protein n=1 Tax=Penicillium concentricum TaxID=293559 RepID=A0A9W9SVY3_9EURO|nr:uncharacterized protein N7517_002440 [Penicillium concentricum]KAJ5384529.1 hypothetical protein N7517_002440 [Penicillium concentricum]
MAETRSSPKVITLSLPNLDIKCEDRFKNYDFTNITHVVVHLSDIIIKSINANTDTSSEYVSEDYLNIIAKMLSVKFFGNETQLECLDTERLGRRKFVAFTNIEKKMERVQSQSPCEEKLEVIEVMFLRTNPRETQKAFWRPARALVFRKVLARVKQSLVEMVRLRVMWTRLNVSTRKLQRVRKGSASASTPA